MVDKTLEKKLAGEKAAELIENDQIVGVGSGTTVSYFIRKLGERVKNEGLKIKAVPSSYQSYYELIQNNIPLTTLDQHPILDITVDGADEVDKKMNLIKGGGAALTQEKIIGTYTKQLVIIVDSSKYVRKLGGFPLPVEVISKAVKPVMKKLSELGCKPTIRQAEKKMGPVITDNGNLIVDCDFKIIDDPKTLERKINMLPGVVENGLFVDLANLVLIGKENKVIIKEK
ncbi:MAG: ribose-5-phosphate isomerase RpiA [Candidatus Odinarchaeia archaeon]